MSLTDIASTVQSIATVIAVIIGGIWTFFVFKKTRQLSAHLRITYQILDCKLDREKSLLSINVSISNAGYKLVTITDIAMRILQIPTKNELSCIPVGGQVVNWPKIVEYGPCNGGKEYIIEPGEDQSFLVHFIVDTNIQAVVIETMVPNTMIRSHWIQSTVHFLNG